MLRMPPTDEEREHIRLFLTEAKNRDIYLSDILVQLAQEDPETFNYDIKKAFKILSTNPNVSTMLIQ